MRRRPPPSAADPRPGSRGFGSVVLALVCLSVYSGTRARAELSERSSPIAAELGSLRELSGAESEIELNGERLSLRSLQLAEDPATVLELERRGGELRAFGPLRQLTVRPARGGGSDALLARSQRTLRVADMFPSTGDAPGCDFSGVPRPQGGRRLLSAQLVERGAYGLVAYAVEAAPEPAFRRYADELARAGFERLSVVESAEAGGLAIFSRGDDSYIVRVAAAESGSWISVVQPGAGAERAQLSPAGSDVGGRAGEGVEPCRSR